MPQKTITVRKFLVTALVALGSLTCICPASAQGADNETQDADAAHEAARAYFKNGVELLQQNPPNYQDAYYQFILALERSGRNWKVMGNLGLSALKLERDGEALAYYEEYLERGGDAIDPAEREAIEKELLLIRGNLAKVNILSTDPDAQVLVSRQGSSTPIQSYELDEHGKASLNLRSGSFSIVLRNSEREEKWAVVLTPGKEASRTFTFGEASEAAPPPSDEPAPGAAPSASRRSPLFTVGIATAGVGVAALGGGLVAGILSNGREEKAKEDCVDMICPSAGQGDIDAARDLSTVANVLFIGGGVLAATGVTLVVVGSGKKSPPEAATWRISPSLGPTGAALIASGSF